MSEVINHCELCKKEGFLTKIYDSANIAYYDQNKVELEERVRNSIKENRETLEQYKKEIEKNEFVE